MKKIILATALLVAFSIASFAGGKDADRKLLNDLATTLKTSTQVHWINKAAYNAAAFNFNNKTAFAFYDPNDNELVGFGMKFEKADLPESVSDAINKKYGDWEVVDAIAFIDTNGYINYFAQVQKNNKSLALKITPNGSLSIYAKMIADK
jgi:hypothetical protein